MFTVSAMSSANPSNGLAHNIMSMQGLPLYLALSCPSGMVRWDVAAIARYVLKSSGLARTVRSTRTIRSPTPVGEKLPNPSPGNLTERCHPRSRFQRSTTAPLDGMHQYASLPLPIIGGHTVIFFSTTPSPTLSPAFPPQLGFFHFGSDGDTHSPISVPTIPTLTLWRPEPCHLNQPTTRRPLLSPNSPLFTPLSPDSIVMCFGALVQWTPRPIPSQSLVR